MGFGALVSGPRFMSLRHRAHECPQVKHDEPKATYCGYKITVSVYEDPDGRGWRPKPIVSWANGRQTAYLPGPKCLATEREAERNALELAKSWVDEWMGGPVALKDRPKK